MLRRQALVLAAYKNGHKEAQQAVSDGQLDVAEALLIEAGISVVYDNGEQAPKHLPAKAETKPTPQKEKAPVKPSAPVKQTAKDYSNMDIDEIMALPKSEQKQALAQALNENARLKKQSNRELTFKVSEKGAVQVNGLGRFPTTLYQEQMIRLLNAKDDILEFIEEHKAELKSKGNGNGE